MDAKLTTQAVRDILAACQGTEGDLKVEGIVGYFYFNREKLEEHRQQIIDLLYELPTPSRCPTAAGGRSYRLATTATATIGQSTQRWMPCSA